MADHKSKQTRALLAGLLAGLAAPGSVFSAPGYPVLSGDDLARLRRGGERVGEDFRKVIEREHGQAAEGRARS